MPDPAENAPSAGDAVSWNGAWILIAVAIVGLVMLRMMGPQPEQHEPLGQRLPQLDAAGWINTARPPQADELRNSVVLVDCFASWCGPCREGMPRVANFYKQFHNQGLVLVGLSPESGAEVAQLKSYVASVPGMDWPIGYGANMPLDLLGIEGYPTLILFDKSGRSVWKGHSIDGLEDAAVAALAQKDVGR